MDSDSDLARDKADHTLAVLAATTDPIYHNRSHSKNGGEVYVVG
jgi:hypothetical protein